MKILTSLIDTLRSKCSSLFDKRKGSNGTYSMHDALMSAFSCFFMQCASFLEHQQLLKDREIKSNCETLFHISKIPTHVQIGNILDGVNPNHFDSVFKENVRVLQDGKALESFKQFDGRTLIALDGTELFKSYKLHCENCSHRKRSNGKVQYFHSFLGAAIVAPGNNHVIPLPPEFISPQDGHDKQDCEYVATLRWLEKHGESFASLRPIYLGDDLFAKHDICEAITSIDGSFILTCKPDSHKALMEYVQSKTLEEYRVSTIDPEVKKGKNKGKSKHYHHHYRWLNEVPIRSGEASINVNYFEVTITDDSEELIYRNSWVTDLKITGDNIEELVRCGRARWKVENEKFNILKNQGYHLEYNFAHGEETLANLYVALNLLAFAFHTTCGLMEELWKEAKARRPKTVKFFHRLQCILSMFVFASWESCIQFMIQPNVSLVFLPSG